MIYHTHCGLRLGDNFAALLLVRALAKANPSHEFAHAANLQYMRQAQQLPEIVADLSNVRIVDIAQKHPDSVDLWKGADDYWYYHKKRNDYVTFMLEFYERCCDRLGLWCPIETMTDFLFDYPAIKRDTVLSRPFDWLVVNSVPMSGQFQGYSAADFDAVIKDLCARYSVVTTADSPHHGQLCASTLSATQIGNLSLYCKYILMVSTGCSWPTFNVWNYSTVQLRIVLLDSERLNLGNTVIHRRSVRSAHEFLRDQNYL